MQREPDGIVRSAFHAVTAVGGDEKRIAGGERDGFAGFEAKFGFATEQQHPFAAVLIIPESIRAGRAAGNDVLQGESGMPNQDVDGFLTGITGGGSEQIRGGFHDNTLPNHGLGVKRRKGHAGRPFHPLISRFAIAGIGARLRAFP